MYNYIKGTITEINAKYITLENNQIGYLIKTPNPFAFELNQNTTIYIYQYVREDIIDLYGFSSKQERDFFLQLISVKGLGPKGALAILASGNLSAIIDAIKAGNNRYLERFPGIGAKASQQIVLDLHGKISFEEEKKAPVDPKINQTIEALRNLGYKAQEIKKVIPILEANINEPTSTLVRIALKNI